MRSSLLIAVAGFVLSAGCASSNPSTGGPTSRPATTQPHPQESLLSDITQLTSGYSRAGEAYFSPDRRHIIFQAVPLGESQYQMYVMPLEWKKARIAGTGQPIRISPTHSRNTCGFFHPTQKGTILFSSTAGKEKPDDPSGGYQRQGRSYVWAFPTGMEIFQASLQSIPPGAANADLAQQRLTNNDVYDAEASYSPDGKWICYTHGAGKDADIYIMRADGTNAVRITSAPGYDGGPFFSPDGRHLVYRSDRKSNDLLQIFIADLAFDAGGNITGLAREHQLTNDNHVNWGPYWHPKGNHIIYASSAAGHQNYELFLMNADGSGRTRVTYQQGADVLPVFSPDGRWLMWTSKRTADNTTQVFSARFRLPNGQTGDTATAGEAGK